MPQQARRKSSVTYFKLLDRAFTASRNLRLKRLGVTAPSSLFPAATPIRGSASGRSARGSTMSTKKRCGHERPFCRTRSNSPRGRKRHTRAIALGLLLFPVDTLRALGLRAQPIASLGAAGLQNLAAVFGGYACTDQ